MFSTLWRIIGKRWDILIYLFFGVVTTIINYAVYFPLYNYFGLSALISNVAAWCVAVAAAFITNKPFVFKSNDWSVKVWLPELVRFVACRFGSGAAESLILFITVDVLSWNGNVWKFIVSVLVVVLNYVSSKLLVFRK